MNRLISSSCAVLQVALRLEDEVGEQSRERDRDGLISGVRYVMCICFCFCCARVIRVMHSWTSTSKLLRLTHDVTVTLSCAHRVTVPTFYKVILLFTSPVTCHLLPMRIPLFYYSHIPGVIAHTLALTRGASLIAAFCSALFMHSTAQHSTVPILCSLQTHSRRLPKCLTNLWFYAVVILIRHWKMILPVTQLRIISKK